MAEPTVNPEETRREGGPEQAAPTPGGRMAGSMHDNVPEWSDPVCPCEAEPYWAGEEEIPGHDQ